MMPLTAIASVHGFMHMQIATVHVRSHRTLIISVATKSIYIEYVMILDHL